ncbi:SYNGR1 [Cordylochernes scorpioides]|uniref:SYNGR1 n=1 Tax=Cordylochernes scorpioides TaxID=51811 RepID=A0ABY6KL47_9ARAC|nr:SYNGR1 [Cordylochernes scorpioides]
MIKSPWGRRGKGSGLVVELVFCLKMGILTPTMETLLLNLCFFHIQSVPKLTGVVVQLFAVVVFGCVSSEGRYEGRCLYNNDPNACNYAVGIGVIAFLASIGFLVVEALFDSFSSIKIRRRAVMADIAFSAFWSFMWFVGFCYLCDAWRKSEKPIDGYGLNNLRAAIAFSFFSIFPWAGCSFFAYQRYRQGVDAAFAPSYEAEPHDMMGAPYTSYPDAADMTETYQEPPFSAQPPSAGMTNFQPAAY